MDNEQLLNVVKAIQNGSNAAILLNDLELLELKWLLDQLEEIYQLKSDKAPLTKPILISRLISVFDSIELVKPAAYGSAKDQIFGTIKDGVSPLSSRTRKHSTNKLPPYLSHLITPTQYCLNLGLRAESIGLVRKILADLHQQVKENNRLVIKSGHKDIKMKDEIFYGCQDNGRYTYFSNKDLGPYIMQHLKQLPLLKNDGSLISVSEFIPKELKLGRSKSSIARTKKAVLDLLEDPGPFEKKFPGKNIYDYIKCGRTAGHTNVILVKPELKDLVMHLMGIPDPLPKEHSHLKPKSFKIMELGMRALPGKIKDLDKFLTTLLLKDPDRIINQKTGKKLRDAVLRYKHKGYIGIYIHKDLNEYLLENWFARLPDTSEWYTGQRLCKKLGTSWVPPEKITAIQELLKEQKDKAINENRPLPQIRRFSLSSTIGVGYYINEEGLEKDFITRQILLDRVKTGIRNDRPR